MKAKKIFAALFVAVLIISLSLSLFACDDPNSLNPLNPNVAPTEDNFATIYSAFLNTSNVTFDLILNDESTRTNLAVEPNETRTSSLSIEYKNQLCSNIYTRYWKDDTMLMLITFNPKNVYYKGDISSEWNNENDSKYINRVFEANYWTALQENETLTIQKLFASNPQFKDLFTSSDLSVNKIENNVVYLNDIAERQCTLEEAKAFGAITDQAIKDYNITIAQLDLKVAFKDIQITIDNGKVSTFKFTFEASGTTDMTTNGERNYSSGHEIIEIEAKFSEYGTTALSLDNPINTNHDAITEEKWNEQLSQYTLENVLKYNGTGKAFHLSYPVGESSTKFSYCHINPNNIYLYSRMDKSINSYYIIDSITDDQFTYTELKSFYNEQENGELYKLATERYTYYYPQAQVTETLDNLESNTFITIQTTGDIINALEFDNFTYVTDHYEQIASVHIETSGIPNADVTNAKVYFNNGLLTKITCDITIAGNTIPYTLTFGYDFTFNIPTKVETTTTA